jgi:hypothetical protein
MLSVWTCGSGLGVWSLGAGSWRQGPPALRMPGSASRQSPWELSASLLLAPSIAHEAAAAATAAAVATSFNQSSLPSVLCRALAAHAQCGPIQRPPHRQGRRRIAKAARASASGAKQLPRATRSASAAQHAPQQRPHHAGCPRRADQGQHTGPATRAGSAG